MTRPFPLHTGIAEVTAIAAITPSMARFTLSHPAFADFGVEEPGEIVTLGWCDDDEELVLPLRRWRFPAGRPEQHWRNYSVRAYRPERAEIDVDFFLHGDLGRAAAWAERAKPGDTVGFAGPRLHWKGAGGFDWSLLVADETGIPALLAILETLPPGHRAIALAGGHEPQEVDTRADADLRWVRPGRARRRGPRRRAPGRAGHRVGRRRGAPDEAGPRARARPAAVRARRRAGARLLEARHHSRGGLVVLACGA